MQALIQTLTKILLVVSTTILAVMMFLTITDVVLRYIFNRPLTGAFELVELMMAIFIPLSIAYCAEQKGHVSVELVLQTFPVKIQKIVNAFTQLITMLFLCVLSWNGFSNVIEIFNSNLSTAVLHIPVYPFTIPVAIAMGIFALITLIHLISPHQRKQQ